jgi:hypothetical protein
MKNKISTKSGIEFFDGETINDNYVLLGNSITYIYDSDGLTLEQGLNFLFDYSDKHNYFFRIDYDLNMLFSKVELNQTVIDFFNGVEIKLYNYKLQYFRHKIFRIKKGKQSVKFFDVSNFFKASFIKTLEILKIDLTETEEEILKEFKIKRSEFSKEEIKQIINYNKIECQLGIKIVQKIYSLLPAELKNYSLYGSSAIAQNFLTQKEIHKKNSFGFYNDEVFESAYFGGRMECFKIGTFGKSNKYDINSAYPYIIKDLRKIKGMENKKYKNQKVKKQNLYLLEFEIMERDLIGLLPIRLKSGYLVFPAIGKGWYYGTEVLELISYSKKYLIEYKISEFIEITLGEKIFNENEIENLFEKRNELKKQNDLRNYIYKILLNSIYGKFAQQIGARKFLNFYYAGFITSSTRAMLLNAVIDYAKEVIFFATDGILINKNLHVNVSYDLGKWEKIKIKKSVVLMSGVYKCIDEKNKIHLGERGFNFNFDKSVEQIKKTGFAEINQNIFIGNKYFDKNKNAFSGYRCKFKKITKILNPANQIKRLYNFDKFEVNKKYNSELIFPETKKLLDKIPKVEFENFVEYDTEID